MNRTVLIRGARQLLTLRGSTGARKGETMNQLGIIEDGSLLIVDGIISNVGPTRRIENLAPAREAEQIDATGRVVMPGFIDSHTHLIAAPPRTDEPRPTALHLQPGPGSEVTRRLAEASIDHVRRSTSSALEHQARKMLQAFLRHGVTTVEVKTGFGLDESGEMKMLRALSHLANDNFNVVPTFLVPYIRPMEFEGSLDDYLLSITAAMLPKIKARKNAHFVDAICDPNALDIEQAQGVLTAATGSGFAVKLHADLTKRTGVIPLAANLDLTTVDGLNHADETDALALSRSRTIAVVMPGALHHSFGSKLAPARMLLDNGVALALASGYYPPLCSTYNMSTCIGIACAHMRLTPEEAITAATINAAHAVGRSGRTGSLEYGKEADVVMLGVSDYREIPYNFGVNLVNMTMQKGKVVYREGAVEWGDKS